MYYALPSASFARIDVTEHDLITRSIGMIFITHYEVLRAHFSRH